MTSSLGYSLCAGVVRGQVSSRSDKMQKLSCSFRILCYKEWHRCLECMYDSQEVNGKQLELCCHRKLWPCPGLYNSWVSPHCTLGQNCSCSGKIWDCSGSKHGWAQFQGEMVLNIDIHSLQPVPTGFTASCKMCVAKTLLPVTLLQQCLRTLFLQESSICPNCRALCLGLTVFGNSACRRWEGFDSNLSVQKAKDIEVSRSDEKWSASVLLGLHVLGFFWLI